MNCFFKEHMGNLFAIEELRIQDYIDLSAGSQWDPSKLERNIRAPKTTHWCCRFKNKNKISIPKRNI